MKSLQYVLIFITLFLIIYLPGFRFFVVSPEYILILLGLGWFLVDSDKVAKALKTKSILLFLSIHLVIILYAAFIDFAFGKGQHIDLTNRFYFKQLRFGINIVFVCLPVAIYLNHKKWSTDDLLTCYVRLAIFQSLLATLMFAVPALRDYILTNVLNLDFLFEEKEERLLGRIYGISSEYLFAYPLFQGFALMVIFMEVIRKNYKNVLFIPFILFSILFNARIGFIALPVITLVYLGFIISRRNSALRLLRLSGIMIFIAALIVVALIFGAEYLELYMIYDELSRGLESDGVGDSHFDNLFGDMIIFPSSILGFIVGEGRYLYQNEADYHSDIGYINDVLFGGLIYLCLYLFNIYHLFSAKAKANNALYYILVMASFTLLVIANYKGPLLGNNSYMRAIIILVFLHILNQKDASKAARLNHNGIVQ